MFASDGPVSVGIAPASDDPIVELQLARRDLAEAKADQLKHPGYMAAVRVQQMGDRLKRAVRAARPSLAVAAR